LGNLQFVGIAAGALWLALIVSVGLGCGLLTGLLSSPLATPAWSDWLDRIFPRAGIGRDVGNFLLIAVAAGGACGLVAWLFAGPVAGIFDLVMIGWFSGLAAVLAVKPNRIVVVETLGWSGKRTLRRMVAALLAVLGWVLVSQASGGLFNSQIYRADDRVILNALAFSLVSGLTGGEIETNARPNQGIYRSARYALVLGLSAWLIVGLAGALSDRAALGLVQRVISGLEFGLAGGFVVGLGWGGFVCLQHLLLRFMLWRNGMAPWRYAHFLGYAAESLFLRKVGGGYVFIHRLLLMHFAERMPAQNRD
ncbi:MAG TPA: hypothetical protein VFX76_15375, partial [Roseiflexaceae bacterium]|nr:hypothetical protein [Roseiflexaceae bacterium]